jgi:energy-coupling factor transporter ATP-binding protein EcfA2
MVQFIVGKKGKGKTKHLLEQANSAIKEASGNVVYLDKTSQKMYELNNKIRLINVSRFPLRDTSEFIGFICGIISQDHDLEVMFLDSYLLLARIDSDEAFKKTVLELENISEQYHVSFILSISKDKEEIPADLQDRILIAL